MENGPLCGCGDHGCLEAFASGPAIVAMAEEYIKGAATTVIAAAIAVPPIQN